MPQRDAAEEERSMRTKLRVYLWGGIAVLVAGISVLYWMGSLFTELDMVTARRVLYKPPRYYSDISTLAPGQRLARAELAGRLRERGYREQSQGELTEGMFAPHGSGALDVFLRSFIAPDGRSIAGLYRFYFSGATLVTIERFPAERIAGGVMFEPLQLGDTRAGGAELRPWVRLETVPEVLRAAVIDAEDRRFYAHPGIDPIGIARAFVVNLTQGGVRQGGSTLTQQLVRNAFLTQKRTLARKVSEAALALIIELRYDKNRIFELYLNQIYLGNNGIHPVYGVEDASRSYFGKPVSALTVSECATIAGMIPAPARRNPRADPVAARTHRDQVIRMLERRGRITAAQTTQALEEPLAVLPLEGQGIGGYYVDEVRRQIEHTFSPAVVDGGGLIVYTAMDPEMQKAAERALASQPHQGAVVALDAYTGYVRALVGGRDFAVSQFNRATMARRSPGSAFKPIIYAAALEEKLFTPDDLLEDKPVTIMSGGQPWRPRNYDNTYQGTVSFRDALVFSRNIPSIHVLQAVGEGRVATFARLMGVRSTMTIVPSMALGTSEVTPLEMTAAYAPFANGGSAVTPIMVRWVTDSTGRVLTHTEPTLTPALSEKTAAVMTGLLREVVDRGTGRGVRALGYAGPAAGKTGTSDYFHDAWFIGYSPSVLCGVWLGSDMPSDLGASAAEIAVPVWVAFIQQAPDGTATRAFGRRYPPGIRGAVLKLFRRLTGARGRGPDLTE